MSTTFLYRISARGESFIPAGREWGTIGRDWQWCSHGHFTGSSRGCSTDHATLQETQEKTNENDATRHTSNVSHSTIPGQEFKSLYLSNEAM